MNVLVSFTRPLQILCLLLAVPLLSLKAAGGAEASYLTILVAGALGTFPMSINNSMTVAGYYTTSPATASAFIRDAAGNITTFNIDGALWTEPESINDAGDIAGFYELVADVPQNFIRFANGRVVTFDPLEDPCGSGPRPSKPFAINIFGEVAGNYYGSCFNQAGFTRSRDGSLDVELYDDHLGAEYPTGFFGLNSNGTLVGFTEGGASGLFVHADGYADFFSVPLGGDKVAQTTIPEAINDDGVIAGWYYNAAFPAAPGTGGFVRSVDGTVTLFDPPGALVPPVMNHFNDSTAQWSAPKGLSMNASGAIAGTFTDAAGTNHGFIRNPYGTITPFDPPNGVRTVASGMNDFEVIAGSFCYKWNTRTPIGFIRIPQ